MIRRVLNRDGTPCPDRVKRLDRIERPDLTRDDPQACLVYAWRRGEAVWKTCGTALPDSDAAQELTRVTGFNGRDLFRRAGDYQFTAPITGIWS